MRGPFAAVSASAAARRFKWAVGAWLGSLAVWAVLVDLGLDVGAALGWRITLAALGGWVLVEFGLCAVVALTGIEYLAWVRQAVG